MGDRGIKPRGPSHEGRASSKLGSRLDSRRAYSVQRVAAMLTGFEALVNA